MSRTIKLTPLCFFMLDAGQYAYHPHYRIISTSLYSGDQMRPNLVKDREHGRRPRGFGGYAPV